MGMLMSKRRQAKREELKQKSTQAKKKAKASPSKNVNSTKKVKKKKKHKTVMVANNEMEQKATGKAYRKEVRVNGPNRQAKA